MPNGFSEHPSEETLERYSMGTLSGQLAASFEEHLLICEVCQARLEQTDAYVEAMRMAAARLRLQQARRRPKAERRKPWRWPKPAWAAAAAVLVSAGIGILYQRTAAPVRSVASVAVALEAGRGPEPAKATEGTPLVLQMDLTELPSRSVYAVEIVDSGGRRVWTAKPRPDRARLAAVVAAGLEKGRYWVRLYGDGELLREYRLEIG